MISVAKSEIPEHLREGGLYRALTENVTDPDEMLTFPSSVLKFDTTLNSALDCDNLLNSWKYWGVDRPTHNELIEFVLLFPSVAVVRVLKKYESEYDYIPLLRRVASAHPFDRMKCAIECGRIDFVRILAEKTRLFPYNACDLAAKVGNPHIMLCLYRHGCTFNKYTSAIAAHFGHAVILALLNDLGHLDPAGAIQHAVLGGHLGCVTFIHSLKDDNTVIDQKKWIIKTALQLGHVHVLQYLDVFGEMWGGYTCLEAAEAGHVACLQFLHEQGCWWGGDVCLVAAKGGHVECLQYAHVNGYPIGENIVTEAVSRGHWECALYAHDNGCPWDASTGALAAQHGQIDCLQRLHEHGCLWDSRTCENAARNGHINCLQYAHTHGCIWDKLTCSIAAQHGHLECLAYAHEQGCKWAVLTTYLAIVHGRLSCLQYACAYGCALPESMYLEPSNPCYELVKMLGILFSPNRKG